ncbi:uncharacterized protein LOC128212295 [Mya arenaria]|uniref:uncharacterized protein LOC128212295 n=1 Tax=Mya arenaria TaxID=6604 RepID=UPI0022E35775|nr:uncharacterized protein LOC128212295 [Mya arenaria]
MDRETCQLMSLRLSRALDDIGVSEWMITRRRRMALMEESVLCLSQRAINPDYNIYNFGSKTEGSTTLGMNSDTDMLLSIFSAQLDCSGWQPDVSFIAFKNERIPPQHCYVQICGPELSLLFGHSRSRDSEGRLLLENTWLDEFILVGKCIRHGPSRSPNEKLDLVEAFTCAGLPEECQFMFSRPRPGHWPRLETLAKARKCPTFIVPQGYPDSENKEIEWRFSTSLMERLLVFDFTTSQMKVYTLLKMIRKSFIKPIVGDRLSTFHLKTAMMFTIESYPPDIWREDQIIQCAIYCLTTLCRWLKLGYSPHFTISGVNLFVGKLNKDERHRVFEEFQDYINESLQIVFSVKMDDLGSRLINMLDSTQYLTVMTRNQMLKSALRIMVIDHLVRHRNLCKSFESVYACTPKFLMNLMTNSMTLTDLTETGNDHKKEAASYLIPICLGTLASTLASECIRLGQPITMENLNLYKMSFDSDLLSSRLKFASMLYCREQFVSATHILSYCESLLGSHMVHTCPCNSICTVHSDEFADGIMNMKISDIDRTSIAYCMEFTIHERYCAPEHLAYDMTMESAEERFCIDTGIKTAAIDSVPFLYYLQYLTYRQLHQDERKRTAFQKLSRQVYSHFGHPETYFNVLAHCFEMENMPTWAKQLYRESLKMKPENNAANWHLRRLS